MASVSAEFHSLHWNNIDKSMLEGHKKVMDHFEIPMNYHNLDQVNHGHWMHWVMQNAKADIVLFFEPDCIPLNNKFIEYIQYCFNHNTFVGIAQVSNHIPPKSHIYAAPAFYCMSKKIFTELQEPSFVETQRSDVGEEICYIAEAKGIRYRALMPTYFEKEPREGVWPLSNLGYYGVGTVYDNSIYHLTQGRLSNNLNLFIDKCDRVINNSFTTEEFISSTTFSYSGVSVP